MIEYSESIKELAPALSKLQADVENPLRNKKAYNYHYADLDEVSRVTKSHLKVNGFSIVQLPFNNADMVGVETILLHSSGEYIKGWFGTKPSKTDPQSIGSLISYYRRYSILSILNLTQADDDGESASASESVELATEGQKKFLFKLLGKEEYDAHKQYIETQLTKKQAIEKIAKLQQKEQ